ncbi:MAG TPA: chlorophyll synthase ChlG [Gemmatimonadaceae bacterium]|nr:chlorophyll synthase ChlG [Gemmatimonadaceae bacterium]
MLTLQSVSPGLHSAERRLPAFGAVLELLKPVTWFPPVWAFSCGVVSAGVDMTGRWPLFALGIALTGPLSCAASQAVNDWFDRHVDAINEPHRPIPSGRIPGAWGLVIAIVWSALALAVGAAFGTAGLIATCIAVVLSWAYSAPPVRLKADGWFGNAAVGLTYEGLAWVTGAVVMLGTLPGPRTLLVALLYSIGAHGIMTLNDFKAIEGDQRLGVHSLPVQLGAERAARLACIVMLLPQVIAATLLLFAWNRPMHAVVLLVLIAVQQVMMPTFLRAPVQKALWYSGFGVPFSVLGMMVCAHALRTMGAA